MHSRLFRHWPCTLRTTPTTTAQRYPHQSALDCGPHRDLHVACPPAALCTIVKLLTHIIGRGHVAGRVPKLSRTLRARSRPMAQGEPDSSFPFWSARDHRPCFAWQPYSRPLMILMPGLIGFLIRFFSLFIPFLVRLSFLPRYRLY
jgi:hypothetical protein